MAKKDNGVTVARGLTFIQMLQIAFIVLKLCGVINWHWLWVLSPILFEIGVLIAAFIIAVLLFNSAKKEETDK